MSGQINTEDLRVDLLPLLVLLAFLCGCASPRPDPLFETPERRAANAVAIREAILQANQAIAAQKSASAPVLEAPSVTR